jgi:hypothetical protein
MEEINREILCRDKAAGIDERTLSARDTLFLREQEIKD